ncbi:hypothetical protein CW680_02710, partial [Candidatus Bathyarchaeota archaeon]
LYYRSGGEWIRLNVTSKDVRRIKRAAEAAAQALNSGLPEEDSLKMVGVDMVLEVPGVDEPILPVLLEANPRPAGLNHSTSLEDEVDAEPKLMVSSAIFRAIRAMRRRLLHGEGP